MKYFNLLLFCFFSFFSPSYLLRATSFINGSLARFKTGVGGIQFYGKNLITDLKNIKFDRAWVKHFARHHPFLTAKAVQEALSFLGFVVFPALSCFDCKEQHQCFGHLKKSLPRYLWTNYVDFFKFMLNFKANCTDKQNFFVSGFPLKSGFQANYIRVIACPFLRVVTLLYYSARHDIVQKMGHARKSR